MSPPATAPRNRGALEERLAAVEARQDGSDAWLKAVAEDAKAARGASERTAALLEGQNFAGRITETQRDFREEHASLRQDMVLAMKNLRDPLDALTKRVDVLDNARQQTKGAAVALKAALEVVKLLVAAGGGALILKLFGSA